MGNRSDRLGSEDVEDRKCQASDKLSSSGS